MGGCIALTSVNLPKLATAGSDFLNGCSSLKKLTLPAVTKINGDFLTNTYLESLTLGGSTKVTVNGTIGGTGSSSTAGACLTDCKLYVPSSLVSSYKSDSKWGKVFSDRIYAIE